MMKLRLTLTLLLFMVSYCQALPDLAQKKGFVYLQEVDPTIKISPRYCSQENFLGKIVTGYKKPIVVLTKQAAQALKEVQKEVKKDGYCLVVYDGYRPQKAVNSFMEWAKDVSDQSKKDHYYPRVDKAKVFELGYIMERSSHTRGSCVDLTLIKDGQELHKIEQKKRTLLDGYVFTYLDDGTVDMGSHFDLFDQASHYENNLVEAKYKKLRTYLKEKMEKHGFSNYAEEWWHFILKNEPYLRSEDSSYFDFDVE